MNYLKAFVLLSLIFLFSFEPKISKNQDWQNLALSFQNIPDTIQTSIYWYWISDNISKEGVIKDLHAMKAVGINRAFIGNIGLEDVPFGDVKIFSDQWWEVLHTALKTASELNIEIGIFNSPGWSQSGGPWVKPEQAMRYLAASDTLVKGPIRFNGELLKPAGDFQDVRVLAFKVPYNYGKSFSDLNPTIRVQPILNDTKSLFDKNTNTEFSVPLNTQTVINFSSEDSFTARSLVIYPSKGNLSFDLSLEVLENGKFKTVKSFHIDRSNNALNVGFEPFAPVAVSFKAVKGKEFRLLVNNPKGQAGIAEIELLSYPKIERYKEKSLAKMHPTPLPYWEDYLWPQQVEPDSKDYSVSISSIYDLTSKLSSSGNLEWQVPEGNWVILRTGMLPTGVTNSPATPEGTGLEVDKMNHEHVIQHFDSFLGEIQRRIPAEDRKTWKVAVQDSYETGGQNWTDNFEKKFEKQFGYNPSSYIPTLFGYVIESQNQSDRFLWDLRRFVANQVAYEYVGGLREVSHKHGLTIWLENYGHWGFPGEFLQYGGQSDEIGGEFWNEGELGDIENRAASSAAHIYGKNKVSAESFTAAGNTYGRYPALMKSRGDRFFAEGINNTLLHVYIHQPYEDKRPGVNTWFGSEFNRFNTWFYDMDIFVDYLKRTNFMLQQGKYVADVAYFIGEDVPKMTGVQDPELPKGYSFDYMNAEVILDRMTMRNGKFTLPDGMQYSVLVLPQLETIRPKVLKKIQRLVKEGGVILGPPPSRSPSLENYTKADLEIQKIAKSLWGDTNENISKINEYGQGKVFFNHGLKEVFEKLKLIPDIEIAPDKDVLFIHRKLEIGDIYFLTNQTDEEIEFISKFRVINKKPELWDAINGSIRELPEYKIDKNTTNIPLKLAPHESVFIVFKDDLNSIKSVDNVDKVNFPTPSKTVSINSPWLVKFDEGRIGPKEAVVFNYLSDWSINADPLIKYYSGSANYSTTFNINNKEGEKVKLLLSSLSAIAKVTINGKYVGGVWTHPYTLDITEYLLQGENTLEIKVVNTWVNRLIGDQFLDEKDRTTWTFENPYTKDSALHPSGLFGPVILEHYK